MTEDDNEDKRLAALFHAFCGRIAAYAARRVPSALVEDVVSRTFETAWRKVASIPADDDAALLWLYGVAWGHVRNTLRAERRRDLLVVRIGGMPARKGSDLSGEVADRIAFEGWLARLSPKDREVLRLSYWEELSVGELAQVLHCKPNAAAVRLHRARRRLEEIVGAEDE